MSLSRISPFALVGTATAGIANGAFWGLAPFYGIQVGADSDAIALLMTITILGGAALQLPLGRISDLVDRRLVISSANALLAVIAGLIAFELFSGNFAVIVLAFLFGGLLLTQYGMCIAHANDFVADGDFVQLASALLLLFGTCAAVGPVLGATLMTMFGPNALFWLIATSSLLCTLYAIWRMRQRDAEDAPAVAEFAPAAAGLSGTILAPNEAAYEGVGDDTPLEPAPADTEISNPDQITKS